MRTTRKLLLTFSLISILAATAFAGETQSPPCAPGETQSPPCTAAQLLTDEPTGPDQTSTAPSADTFDLTSTVEGALIAFLLF
jgi:hypothetical protein